MVVSSDFWWICVFFFFRLGNWLKIVDLVQFDCKCMIEDVLIQILYLTFREIVFELWFMLIVVYVLQSDRIH